VDVNSVDFEEERKSNGKKAWRGYISRFQDHNYFTFKHHVWQRLVHCKECGVAIPKEIPRLYVSGSWNYSSGHYCLDCGIREMDSTLHDRTVMVKELRQNIQELKSLTTISEKCKSKEDYKNAMATVIMLAKLNPKPRRYHY
jgi:hypothetical protein